jgi:3-dehydroquinate synthase
MVMAAELSCRLGLIDDAMVQRLRALIARAGLPVRGALLDTEDNAGKYLELMRVDKKSEAGVIRFVLIHGDGHASMQAVPDKLVREVVDVCCA